jgi:hypothetical protein
MAETREQQLEGALRALCDRLDFMNADKRYRAVWNLFHDHFCNYEGPTYTCELAKAKQVLNAEAPGR